MKKGFTLIELLAVITILFLITLAIIPSIIKQVSVKKDTINDVTLNLIYDAAELYISNDTETYIKEPGSSYCITLGDLVDGQMLDKKLLNFKSGKQIPLTRYVRAKVNDYLSFDYELLKDGEYCGRVYSDLEIVYYNPNTNEKCNSKDYAANLASYDSTNKDSNGNKSPTGLKSGCMKWYAFNDNEVNQNTIDLLLDHNSTAVVRWNESASNIGGPTNILTQLGKDTKEWNDALVRSDKYALNNGTANYTINYSGYKARLITAQEIADIIKRGNKLITWSWDEKSLNSKAFDFYGNEYKEPVARGLSKYALLYDHTSICLSYGCSVEDNNGYDESGIGRNFGYWTSTAYAGNNKQVWSVSQFGAVNATSSDDTHYGLRPVITVSKKVLAN